MATAVSTTRSIDLSSMTLGSGAAYYVRADRVTHGTEGDAAWAEHIAFSSDTAPNRVATAAATRGTRQLPRTLQRPRRRVTRLLTLPPGTRRMNRQNETNRDGLIIIPGVCCTLCTLLYALCSTLCSTLCSIPGPGLVFLLLCSKKNA